MNARNLLETLRAASDRLEVDLEEASHHVRTVIVELTTDLSLAFGQPGFDEALVASRDTIMLEAGLEAVEISDEADAELRGIILGFLSAAAGA